MSGDYEDDLCRRALILVSDLCARVRDADTSDRCQEFNDLRIRGYPRGPDADISVSLLSVIVTFCGIVLLGVSLFVSWKLCWVPWRDKGGSAVGGGPLRKDLGPGVGLAGLFSVPLAELAQRKLHFSVYDFDRFSRHDLIGQVVLDNLLELAEQPPDRPLWRDIVEGGSQLFCLCPPLLSLLDFPFQEKTLTSFTKGSKGLSEKENSE
ncbi:hypothetical protein E2I00_005844 [Balaenoptera physalus]|uniref:C2 domain-containing protein n=1 Tax=Balaenoptera physalus TaxID=9770 RepID=A0A643C8K4_BALPH|nr:hypothetical protein E2I00_005844 [Balaenoptera physalus]